MRRIIVLSFVAGSLVLSACGSFQTVKDSWKFTTRQYRSYLNTPASLDLDDKGSCELYELALSEAVIDVDAELQKLIRAMENSDHNPDQAWVMNIMHRVPWLSGVALVDNKGTKVAQYPEYFANPFDAGPLLEPDPKQRMGALRAYAQMTDAGPEIYLGNPVYGGEELRGLIIAYFDPRTLVTMSSDPGSFMIACPGGILWPGRYGSAGPVGNTDWAQLLMEKSCGIIGSKESEFFWTTRYVGNLPLVYAMPTSAGREALLPKEDAPAGAASAQPSEPRVTPLQDTVAAPDKTEGAPATPAQAPAKPVQRAAKTPAKDNAKATGQAVEGQESSKPMAWPAEQPEMTAPVTAPPPGSQQGSKEDAAE